MAHEIAPHTHVILENVHTGPGRLITDLTLDNVEYIRFGTTQPIDIGSKGRVISIDYHDIDDITCVLTAEAVTFTIVGNV